VRTEPALVSSNPSVGCVLFALLEGGGLCDLAVPISDGLASVEKLLLTSAGGVDVEVLTWKGRKGRKGRKPSAQARVDTKGTKLEGTPFYP
jgi:hypothetical protein